MQHQVSKLSVRANAAQVAEMNAFLRGHRVLAVKKEFMVDGENFFWSFCVEESNG